MPVRWLLPATVAAALALSGCGGSSDHAARGRQVSVPAYGVVPATTVGLKAAARRSEGACRARARVFAGDALDFLAHFGPAAAYPADLNYVIIREDLAAFRGGRCDLRILGRVLEQRLTAGQRRDLLDDLPTGMAGAIRRGLNRAR